MTTNPTDGGAVSTHFVCTTAEFLAATPADRLRLVQRQIHATPERWDQASWLWNYEGYISEEHPHVTTSRCGARHCIAGWASALAGDAWISDEKVRDSDGDEWFIRERATDLLGLTHTQATNLFLLLGGDGYSEGDLDNLDRTIEELLA